MIHVIAVLTAKPGKRDAVLKEFRANVPNVKAEKGCIEYGAAVDTDPGPSFQAKYGADTFGRPESPRRPAAHGGLCGQGEGHDGEPGDLRAFADLIFKPGC